MEQTTPPAPRLLKKKTGSKILLFILSFIIVLLGSAGGYLGYKYFTNRELLAQKETEMVKLQNEYAAVLDSLAHMESLVQELQKEQLLSDSLAQEQLAYIENLKQDLRKAEAAGVRYTGGENSVKMQELRKSLAGYQEELAALKMERDSLRTRNESLVADIKIVSDEKVALAQTNKELQEKMEAASSLQVYEIKATSYRAKKNGDKLPEEKAKKVSGLEINVVILENQLAEEKDHTLYVVVTGPDKKVLGGNSNNTFEYLGEKQTYTVSKQFSYVRRKTDLLLKYEPSSGSFQKGKYLVEIFLDGTHFGRTKFELK